MNHDTNRFKRGMASQVARAGQLLVWWMNRLPQELPGPGPYPIEKAVAELQAGADIMAACEGLIRRENDLRQAGTGHDIGDTIALFRLLAMVSSDIHRLARCPVCKNWFFKRTRGTLCCSPYCRLKHWREQKKNLEGKPDVSLCAR
jgi:hypothetical protein